MRAIENNFGTTSAQSHAPFFQKEGKQGFFNSGESSSFFNGTQTRGSAIQTSLTVGKSNDPLEREADEKADHLVQSKTQANASGMCSECAEEEKLQKKENKPDEEKEEHLQKKENRLLEDDEKEPASVSAVANETDNKTEVAAPASPEKAPEAATSEPGERTAIAGNYLTPLPQEEEPGLNAMPGLPQIMGTALPAITYALVQPIPAIQRVPQIQQRANVSLAPQNLSCILMDAPGTPGTLNVFFDQDVAALDGGDLADIENFVGTWVAGGLSDDLLVSGYASEEGSQGHNWRLSCERAEAVSAELKRIGIPDSKISNFAHGETTDFDATNHEPNRRTTVTTTAGTGPTITPVLTPLDNFAGRSTTTFGVGESIVLTYTATPSIAAAEHFGVDWNLLAGAGSVFSLFGTGLYTAGSTSGLDILTLNVNTGPATGTILAAAAPIITAPTFSYMRQAPGSNVCHTNNWASVGIHGEVLMMPTDVSFNGAQWREGTGTMLATGTFSSMNGRAHTPTATWMSIGTGNAGVGCQVNTFDTVTASTGSPDTGWFGLGTPDWSGTYIWPIEWQYQVGGSGPLTYMTAQQIAIVNSVGDANISKAASGTFSTRLADPTQAIGGPYGGGVC